MQGARNWIEPLVVVTLVLLGLMIYLPLFDHQFEQLVPLFTGKTTYYLDKLPAVRLLLSLLCVVLAVCFLMRERIFRYKLETIKTVVIIELLVISIYAFMAPLANDGFEHLHASWNVMEGLTPYQDFFEHHHPLLWYLHAPVLSLLGDGEFTLWFVRIECYVMILGFLWGISKIGVLLHLSQFERLVAMSVFLSQAVLIKAMFIFRPDQLQNLFTLWAVYYFLKFLQNKKNKYLLFSGLLWTIAFIFLQKALFILAPMGLALVFLVVTKRAKLVSLIVFTLSILLTASSFFGLYFLNGGFNDYLVFNWIVNFYKEVQFEWWEVLLGPKHILYCFQGVLIFLIGIIIHVSGWHKRPVGSKLILFIALLMFVLIAITPRPTIQYYFACFALLSIVSVEIVKVSWPEKLKKMTWALAPGLLLFPLLLIIVLTPVHANFSTELSIVRFVRNNSAPGDYVWDSRREGIVFRPDMHYFWFHFKNESVINNYDHYQTILNSGKYASLVAEPKEEFDFCSILTDKKPELIIERETAFNKLAMCGNLKDQYEIVHQTPPIYKRVK